MIETVIYIPMRLLPTAATVRSGPVQV
uniref:Uncharacterized protein n=1 Tax=Anguilla anguilla TaxID=7936 RepID=A0A0E9V1R1_ANGAN